MDEPGCRHVPPCPSPAGCRERQRDEYRRAVAARAAFLRNRRGRRRARRVLPGMIRLPPPGGP